MQANHILFITAGGQRVNPSRAAALLSMRNPEAREKHLGRLIQSNSAPAIQIKSLTSNGF